MINTFYCFFDLHTLVTTGVVNIVFVVLLFVRIKARSKRWIFRLIISLTMTSLNTVCIIQRPMYITLHERAVEVYTIKETFHINLDKVTIEKFDWENAGAVHRLNASDGLWGYFGIFKSSKIGKFRMCASQKTNLVIIEQEGQLPFVMDEFRFPSYTE